MSDIAIPVIVLSARHDDVEFYNKTMRDAGHAVRCQAIAQLPELGTALESEQPHLIVFFADGHAASVGAIAELKELHAPMSPLLVITREADETAISEAMLAGAQDLVSVNQRNRICAVSERELKAFRLERSLHDALHSAMQYKQQLKSLLSKSTNAIAVVQEGIVVEANRAWADLFAGGDTDAALGPIMDAFGADSHAGLKETLVACIRGRRERAEVSADGLSADQRPFPVTLTVEKTTFDGDPAVQLSIEGVEQPAAAAEPGSAELVEQTLHTDLATGFLQRRQFLEVLSEKLAHSDIEGARALAFVQADNFDSIERDLGPVASEEIIGRLAELLGGFMGNADIAGRFSGQTLALILERRNLDEVEIWAENALVRISEQLFEVADSSLSLTCSIGLAELGDGTDRIEEIIHNAERAIARARDGGGNRSVIEETSDESTRIKRIDELRARQIKSALIDGRFRLMHLSIASLSGRSELIYDTFIRLVDEQGDELEASEFIGSAARCGLLRPIDRWVIDASLEFCVKQSSDLVFVKLSHESVLDTSTWSWIQERTAAANIKPSRICFQVSEEDASKYQKQTGALAASLRQRGFRFAVEYFGTGRNSMHLLGSTPMDFVKFDSELSAKLGGDSATQDKVRSFVAQANKRDIRTIATHVENANTMALLFQLGVAYMQGHYLQEPDVVLEAAI